MIKLKNLLPEIDIDQTNPSVVNLPDQENLRGYRDNNRNSYVESDVKDYITANCKVALKRVKDLGIFRGDRADAEAFKVDPRKSQRVCKNGMSNMYFLYIDSSPFWKNIPKRSWSIICSTSSHYARSYSDKGSNHERREPYLVLFEGDPEISYTAKDDFWSAPTNGRGYPRDAGDLNDAIDIMFHQVGYIRIDTFTKSVNDFSRKLKEIEKIANKEVIDFDPSKHIPSGTSITYATGNLSSALYVRLLTEMKSGKSFYDVFYGLFTPKSAQCKTVKLSRIKMESNVECWSEGKCVLIKPSLFNSLF